METKTAMRPAANYDDGCGLCVKNADRLHKPSYATHDPKEFAGDPKRGAALGRPQRGVHETTYAGVITLHRVRLDANGYDGLGTYWGLSELKLYWFSSASGHIDRTVRVATREAAREYVLKLYPKATVRR